MGDRFNDIISKYPSDFSRAVQIAIDQFGAATSQQRVALMKDVDSESNKVHGLFLDARQSIGTARDAAASINADTTQTIYAAQNASERILDRAFVFATALVVIGFAWPALVLLVYKYISRRLRRNREIGGA